jgi:hypothetical protein
MFLTERSTSLLAYLGWNLAPARPASELQPTTVAGYSTSNDRLAQKPCGHERHVGTCPSCQRGQLAKWDAQLAQASGFGAQP